MCFQDLTDIQEHALLKKERFVATHVFIMTYRYLLDVSPSQAFCLRTAISFAESVRPELTRDEPQSLHIRILILDFSTHDNGKYLRDSHSTQTPRPLLKLQVK